MNVSRVAAVILVIVIAACAGRGSGLIGTIGGPNGASNPGAAFVQVVNFAFRPSAVKVRPGGFVTWTWNSDTTTHNIVFSDGIQNAGPRNSGTHTRTFASAGTISYTCTLHVNETGSVTVQ